MKSPTKPDLSPDPLPPDLLPSGLPLLLPQDLPKSTVVYECMGLGYERGGELRED